MTMPAPPGGYQQQPYATLHGGPPPGFQQQPGRGSFWGTTGGILLIVFGSISALAIFCVGLTLLGQVGERRSAPKQIEVQLTSCTGSGSVATVGYTVTNNGSTAQSATLDIEYRDAAGARLDTDTSYVGSVPAGDTVRGEETTHLNATPDSAITCKIVGIS